LTALTKAQTVGQDLHSTVMSLSLHNVLFVQYLFLATERGGT